MKATTLLTNTETAKANKVEPYAYLRKAFMLLPQAETVSEVEALLPWNLELH